MAYKVTSWFPASVKPERPGLYEVRVQEVRLSVVRWSRWTGREWMCALEKPASAFASKNKSIDMYGSESRWRGLAAPATTKDSHG